MGQNTCHRSTFLRLLAGPLVCWNTQETVPKMGTKPPIPKEEAMVVVGVGEALGGFSLY